MKTLLLLPVALVCCAVMFIACSAGNTAADDQYGVYSPLPSDYPDLVPISGQQMNALFKEDKGKMYLTVLWNIDRTVVPKIPGILAICNEYKSDTVQPYIIACDVNDGHRRETDCQFLWNNKIEDTSYILATQLPSAFWEQQHKHSATFHLMEAYTVANNSSTGGNGNAKDTGAVADTPLSGVLYVVITDRTGKVAFEQSEPDPSAVRHTLDSLLALYRGH